MSHEPIDARELASRHLDARVTVRSEKDFAEPGPEWSVRGVLDQVTHRCGDNGPSVLLTLLVNPGPSLQSITLEVEPTARVELHGR